MLDLQFDRDASSPFYLNRVEAQYLYEHDIPAYFECGIELEPGDTVFDVGANIGLFDIATYQRFGSDINIYAFEPIPMVYDVLRRNKERYGLDKLRIFPFGLAEKRDVLTFSYFPRLPSRSSACLDVSMLSSERGRFKDCLLDDVDEGKLLPALRWLPRTARSIVLGGIVTWLFKAERFACEVRTFSETIRDCGIDRVDLLKVDVEGAELDVLNGIEAEDWPKIKQVLIEIEHFREQSPRVVELLNERGFRHFELDDADEVLRRGDVGILYARRRASR